MQNCLDYNLLCLVHGIAWTAFLSARLILRKPAPGQPAIRKSQTSHASSYSAALIAFHGVGFGVMYHGIAQARNTTTDRYLFLPLAPLGALVILSGAALMCWAMSYFRSWRLHAKIDTGHELATGGPFAWLRHPIYAGIDLLAIGTVLWLPTQTEMLAVLLLIIGSDLRARAEEIVLVKAFGETYTTYMARTKRFIPGLY